MDNARLLPDPPAPVAINAGLLAEVLDAIADADKVGAVNTEKLSDIAANAYARATELGHIDAAQIAFLVRLAQPH